MKSFGFSVRCLSFSRWGLSLSTTHMFSSCFFTEFDGRYLYEILSDTRSYESQRFQVKSKISCYPRVRLKFRLSFMFFLTAWQPQNLFVEEKKRKKKKRRHSRHTSRRPERHLDPTPCRVGLERISIHFWFSLTIHGQLKKTHRLREKTQTQPRYETRKDSNAVTKWAASTHKIRNT